VRGEILIADRQHDVHSHRRNVARVVAVKGTKAMGNAWRRRHLKHALGEWILMATRDDSYDFSEADRFVEKFKTR